MIRILSNGLAAVGLAAVVALIALMSGSAAVKPAEAAPTSVLLAAFAPVTCGNSALATATVVTPDPGTTVTFTSSAPTVASVSAVAVSAATGTASTPVTTFVGMPGSALITATVTGTALTSSQTITVTCTGTVVNPCTGFYTLGCGGCGSNIFNYSGYNTSCGGCDPYSNLGGYGGYGGIYGGAYGGCNIGCGNPYAGNYSGIYGQYAGVLPQYGAGFGGYGCGSNFGACSNAYGPILNCTSGGYGGYNPGLTPQFAPGRVSILPSASSVACGGATAITVVVTDPSGFKVADGTNVTFTTSLGYVTANDQTIGGTAVSSLTIPPGTSGSARVTAAAGGQSADTTINVTCATGAPPVVVQPLPVAPFPFQFPPQAVRPVIVPPSTGDAGLAAD